MPFIEDNNPCKLSRSSCIVLIDCIGMEASSASIYD